MEVNLQMKKVKNEIYYHINSSKPFNIGDILNVGLKYNNFYYEIYNIKHSFNNMDANEILLKMKQEHRLLLDKNEASIIFNTINDDAMITRELMFEEVRKEINSKLPSRLKCLYVCENQEEVENWLDIFKRTNKKTYQILKLKLTGDIFIGDASFILRQNISLNEKREQAKLYWSGARKNNINEYLFTGKAEVVDIFDVDKQNKNK